MAKKKKETTFNSLEALGNSFNSKESSQQSNKKLIRGGTKNFYSFLHKRNRFFEDNNQTKKHPKFSIKKINTERVKKNNRGRLEDVALLDKFNNWESNNFYNEFTKRHLDNANSICQQVSNQNFQPSWRLIIGLGTDSVFETSMSLHHIYGFPYISASGIKGVVRSYVITTAFGTEKSAGSEKEFPLINAEFRALTESEEFCELFGCPANARAVKFQNGQPVYKKDKSGKDTNNYDFNEPIPVAKKNSKGQGQENQGSIIFFDAYPITSPSGKIKADIMNPHYPDYYNDKEAPTDHQQPIPIIFLTVEKLAFQFILGSTYSEWENWKIGGKNIIQWLKDALENHGIGAKTAVGYGYMKGVS